MSRNSTALFDVTRQSALIELFAVYLVEVNGIWSQSVYYSAFDLFLQVCI